MHGARPHHCCPAAAAPFHILEGQRRSPLPHSLPPLSPSLATPSLALLLAPSAMTAAMDGRAELAAAGAAPSSPPLHSSAATCSTYCAAPTRNPSSAGLPSAVTAHRRGAIPPSAPVRVAGWPQAAVVRVKTTNEFALAPCGSPAPQPPPTSFLWPASASYSAFLCSIRDQGPRPRIRLNLGG
jgi:hypothetical protein